MATTVTTKFDYSEFVYILAEAQKGFLRGGPVEDIIIQILNGTPLFFYKITNHDVLIPPGGYWQEAELGTETEARTLSSTYHSQQSGLHAVRAAQHAP